MSTDEATPSPAYPIESEFSTNHHVVLHLGDTLEFTRSLPAELVQLIITSPPYNIGKEYETRVSIQSYLQNQEIVIDELIRTLKTGGSLCWQVGNYVENAEAFPLDVFFYSMFKERGLRLRNRIIWRFGHGLHAFKRFSGRYEAILWFTKGDEYVFNLDDVRVPSKYPGKRHSKEPRKGEPSGNPLGKNPSDVWEFIAQDWDQQIWDIPNVKANHPEKTIHPCQFPIELVERCVLALTNEDDWVFDPYCGVGSALIAGVRRGRRVVGTDKEPQYIEIARHRIEDLYTGRLIVRQLGKPVYKPTGRERVARVPDEWRVDSE